MPRQKTADNAPARAPEAAAPEGCEASPGEIKERARSAPVQAPARVPEYGRGRTPGAGAARQGTSSGFRTVRPSSAAT